MEGECGQVGSRADRAAAVGRPRRAGRVLDDGDAARIAERPHRVEVRRDACLVHQDHRAGAVGQQRLDRGRGQVQRRRVDVGEHRLGADVACRVRGGDEGQRRHDDLVAGGTPATIMARCRPVVQEETATACPAPVASANAASNSATRGPCAIQPDVMASAAAAASSAPSNGRMTGIIAGPATRRRGGRVPRPGRSRPSSRVGVPRRRCPPAAG